MNRRLSPYLAIYCLALLFISTGCQQSKETSSQSAGHGHDHDHDHSGRPANLRAALEELKVKRDVIGSAMEENDTDAAHEPLHEVSSLLEAIPNLAADTDLPENDWNGIKAEVEKLFDAFGEIDSAFHRKEGDKRAAYDAAKSKINEGIAALESYLPELSESHSSAEQKHNDADHDHADHDHDDEKHGDDKDQRESSE